MISLVVSSGLSNEETGGMVTTMGRRGVLNGSRREGIIGRKKEHCGGSRERRCGGKRRWRRRHHGEIRTS
jgi:hypothetical protein